jgi:hypothetical protein
MAGNETPHWSMKYFLKVLEGIDVGPLVEQIEAHPELWGQFGWRKNIPGGPHKGMTDIWVRYNDYKNLGPKFNDEHESVWYPAYEALPALKPILDQLMKATDGKRLGGILITKIPAGGSIAKHIDRGWHVDTYDKFYVSLKSSPRAKFICFDGEGETLEPKAGECWRFDNRLPHSVENESKEDRVTLIVCIETDKYHLLAA